MGMVDDLQKLEQLRAKGTLTDAEFIQAKARLLTNSGPSQPADEVTLLKKQIADLHRQNELVRIDREWEIERQQFQIVGRQGTLFAPTLKKGITTILAAVLFGTIWIASAVTVYRIANDVIVDGVLSSILKTSLPLLAVIFMVVAVFNVISLARGIYCCLRANKYNQARIAYQDRRQKAELNDLI